MSRVLRAVGPHGDTDRIFPVSSTPRGKTADGVLGGIRIK